MRNLIVVGALALLVLSPLPVAAQQRAAPTPTAPAPTAPTSVAQTTVEGYPLNKVLAIGVGALVGAVAVQAIVGGEVVVALVGGAAGGLVGAWWYDNGSSVRVAMPSLPSAGVLKVGGVTTGKLFGSSASRLKDCVTEAAEPMAALPLINGV